MPIGTSVRLYITGNGGQRATNPLASENGGIIVFERNCHRLRAYNANSLLRRVTLSSHNKVPLLSNFGFQLAVDGDDCFLAIVLKSSLFL